MAATKRSETFFHLIAGLILCSTALVQAYNYYSLVSKPFLADRMELHYQIILGTAPSPYLYRDLIPFLAHVLFRVGRFFLTAELAFTITYLLLDFAGISLVLFSLYVYLRRWFKWELSLAGALFCAGVIGITAHDHYFQPWSFWEAGFFTLSLLLMLEKRLALLGILVAAASLNRETAVFIPLVFLATTQDLKALLRGKFRPDWKSLAWVGAYMLIWAAVFSGLRLLRGNAPHVETLQQIFAANLDPSSPWKAALNLALFQGVFWIFAVLGFKSAPQFIRRTAWIIPPYLALVAVWSYWYEVRVLMSLYAVIIPLAVHYLAQKTGGIQPSHPPTA